MRARQPPFFLCICLYCRHFLHDKAHLVVFLFQADAAVVRPLPVAHVHLPAVGVEAFVAALGDEPVGDGFEWHRQADFFCQFFFAHDFFARALTHVNDAAAVVDAHPLLAERVGNDQQFVLVVVRPRHVGIDAFVFAAAVVVAFGVTQGDFAFGAPVLWVERRSVGDVFVCGRGLRTAGEEQGEAKRRQFIFSCHGRVPVFFRWL